jgi:hypothetical protein
MVTHSELTRRDVLKAGGVVTAVALASQSPVVGSAGGTVTATTGRITDVEFDKGRLYVRVATPADAESIVLIDPNGQQYAESTLRLGETAGAFDVLATGYDGPSRYTPGTYTAKAYDGNDRQVGSVELTMEPRLEVTGFETLGNGWPRIHVTNRGSGPSVVNGVAVTAGVPFEDTGTRGGFSDTIVVDPGQTRLFEYYKDGFYSPVTAMTEATAAEFCGESRTADFTVYTDGFGTFSNSLELTYGAGPRRWRVGLASSRYSCADSTGGETV